MTIGNWSSVEVGGHPCDIFEPAKMNSHGYVVMYLHGVHQGQLNDKPEFVEQFEELGLPVIGPRTKRSWWSSRICEEFDETLTAEQHVLQNVMPYIEQRWNAKQTQVALLGTSMGGQGALRLSYKYPNKFPIAAAISPAIDHYTRMQNPEEEEPLFDMYSDPEDCRQDSATLHIHPLNWPRHQFFCCDPTDYRWIDSADRLRMKLWSLGVPFECDMETTGGGHGFSYYCVMAEKAMAFIANALDRERLRVA